MKGTTHGVPVTVVTGVFVVPDVGTVVFVGGDVDVLIGVDVRVGIVPVGVTVGENTLVLLRVGVVVLVNVRVGVPGSGIAVDVLAMVGVGVDAPGLHANSTSSQYIVESTALALYEMIR